MMVSAPVPALLVIAIFCLWSTRPQVIEASFVNPDALTGNIEGIVNNALDIPNESKPNGQGPGPGPGCPNQSPYPFPGQGVPPCSQNTCDFCPISGTKSTSLTYSQSYTTTACGSANVVIRCVTENNFNNPTALIYDSRGSIFYFLLILDCRICSYRIRDGGTVRCASVKGIFTTTAGLYLTKQDTRTFLLAADTRLFSLYWDGYSDTAYPTYISTPTSSAPNEFLAGFGNAQNYAVFFRTISTLNFNNLGVDSNLYYYNNNNAKFILKRPGIIGGAALFKCNQGYSYNVLGVTSIVERTVYKYNYNPYTYQIEGNAQVILKLSQGAPVRIFPDSDTTAYVAVGLKASVLYIDFCRNQVICEIPLPSFDARDVGTAPCTTVPNQNCLYVLTGEQTCSASNKDPRFGTCLIEVRNLQNVKVPPSDYTILSGNLVTY